jgi:metal-sulfur cluster biosynthetic enzyme
VALQLTLTTPGCSAQTQIVAQIENRLAAFERVSKTEVTLVWQPAWTPERISPEGRKRLGIDGGNPQTGVEHEQSRRTALPSRKNNLVQLR